MFLVGPDVCYHLSTLIHEARVPAKLLAQFDILVVNLHRCCSRLCVDDCTENPEEVRLRVAAA
jgi:hypothetical protein